MKKKTGKKQSKDIWIPQESMSVIQLAKKGKMQEGNRYDRNKQKFNTHSNRPKRAQRG